MTKTEKRNINLPLFSIGKINDWNQPKLALGGKAHGSIESITHYQYNLTYTPTYQTGEGVVRPQEIFGTNDVSQAG